MYKIISFLGLIIGIVLAKIFKNELRDIKNFLKILGFILIIIIILKLIFLVDINLMFFIGIILGILMNYFLKNNYLYFGFILVLTSFLDDTNKIYFGILIFIYGLVYSALNNMTKKKIIIMLISFALPFIFLLTNLDLTYNNFIVGFIVGGLAIGINQFDK